MRNRSGSSGQIDLQQDALPMRCFFFIKKPFWRQKDRKFVSYSRRKALNQGSFELYGRVYATLLLRQQSKQKRLATASSVLIRWAFFLMPRYLVLEYPISSLTRLKTGSTLLRTLALNRSNSRSAES